jgi:L-aspartate oxidase
MKVVKTEVLVIGGGLAGLKTAQCLYPHKNVNMITKSTVNESNSIKAQGGIAAAIGKGDHWSDHYVDTLTAGDGHNCEIATERLVKDGVKDVWELVESGVPFDRDFAGNLCLGREGAHRANRILHAGGDATGKAVIDTLSQLVIPNITLHESEILIDLVTKRGQCFGAIVKNLQNEIIFYEAEHTVLATGGVGGLYKWTSNDETVTGDGLAAAHRAGAELADLEFVQFHPTMLVSEKRCGGLVSEAVRGEGARLVTDDGILIMEGIHEQLDLAPRDIVARTIHDYFQDGKKVFLDISTIPHFKKRFPTISNRCDQLGINLEAGRIPVAPGAHFIMGGIVTDGKGRTNIRELYAVGEVACTGVHGANRLASNSLLEGLVFASETAKGIIEERAVVENAVSEMPKTYDLKQQHPPLPTKADIQKQMMDNVGISRTEEGLVKAKKWFKTCLKQSNDGCCTWGKSVKEIEIINMLTVGWLISTSALARTESRGGHYRSDYPYKSENNWQGRRIVRRGDKLEQDQIERTTEQLLS